MAWIRTIPEPDAARAGGPLAALYERIRDPATGAVDNVLAVHSLHPAGLEAHWTLYRAVMRGTRTLPQADRELIAVAVSAANGCHY